MLVKDTQWMACLAFGSRCEMLMLPLLLHSGLETDRCNLTHTLELAQRAEIEGGQFVLSDNPGEIIDDLSCGIVRLRRDLHDVGSPLKVPDPLVLRRDVGAEKVLLRVEVDPEDVKALVPELRDHREDDTK